MRRGQVFQVQSENSKSKNALLSASLGLLGMYSSLTLPEWRHTLKQNRVKSGNSKHVKD